MRVTVHNGRANTNGAYSVRHNDRQFEPDGHIDIKRSGENVYIHRYSRQHPEWSFEDAERVFYERTFKNMLDARNARYEAQRHHERVQSMDDYRRNKKTCPEEILLYVGKKGDTINKRQLLKICADYVSWMNSTFKNVQFLNAALHMDETGAPHMHIRYVWTAKDRYGMQHVSQNAALREMGIERPDRGKSASRYNNAKMTFTRICREQFINICQLCGLDIETEPREPGRSGMTLLNYKATQAREFMSEVDAYAKTVSDNAREIQRQTVKAETQLRCVKQRIENLTEQETATLCSYADACDQLQIVNKQLFELQQQRNQLKERIAYAKNTIDNVNVEQDILEFMNTIKYNDGTTVLDDYNDMQQQKSDDLERAAHVLDDDLEL
jgi:hypothetical protein